MTACISSVCVLGMVIIGILLMTRVISLETVGNAIGRAFLLLVAVLVALCFGKGILMTSITAAIFLLKRLLVWLAIIALVIGFAMLLVRLAIYKFDRWLPGRGNHHRGNRESNLDEV